MKALMLADFYNLRRTGRYTLLFIAAAAVISYVGGTYGELNGFGFFRLYAMLMVGMNGTALLTMDEQSRWQSYAQTLPVTRRDYVTAKYLFTLATVGGTWLLLTGVDLVVYLMGNMDQDSLLLGANLALTVGLICPALILPPTFRFGTARGRVFLIAVIAVLGAVVGTVLNGAVLNDLNIPDRVWRILPPVTAAGLFAGGWPLSIRWFERREL